MRRFLELWPHFTQLTRQPVFHPNEEILHYLSEFKASELFNKLTKIATKQAVQKN